MSTDFGGSWWGKRWIEALERLSTAWQNRLPRGRDYARKGHVISLSVSSGKIAARVQGSRSKPYVTTIEVPALRSSDWDAVIESLAAESRFAAQLLIGIMPADIDDAFAEHNVNLFPARNSEMLGSCTCPDKARPCKHIAAVHYAFGQALDRDPFLLFKVRGADRDRLLAGFNLAWFGEEYDAEAHEIGVNGQDAGIPALPLDADRFNRSEHELGRMSFAPLALEPDLLILDRLGAPRSWSIPVAIEDLLGPVFIEATRLARSIAFAGFDDEDRAREDLDDESGESLRVDDGYTSLAMDELPDEDEFDDDGRPGPKATFVLPKSLGMMNRRIAKAPMAPVEEPKRTAPQVRVRKNVVAQKRDEPEQPQRVPQRPAAAAAPRLEPPPDFVPHDADNGSGPVTVLRGRGTPAGPAIVRRRGSGAIEIVDNGGRDATAPDTATLAADARTAIQQGRATEALRAAQRLWNAELDLDAFLLMMTAADLADRKEDTLQAEGARLLLRSRERNFALSIAEALLLLCAGEIKPVADQVFALGKKAWRDDGPAAPVMIYALLVLLGDASAPRASHLRAWVDEAHGQKGSLDAELGSVGSWLEWAVTERPPPPTVHDRLARVARELATWALGASNAVGGPEAAARWACAVAETFELARIEGGAMPFLASLQGQVAKKKRLVDALEQAVASSAVLS